MRSEARWERVRHGALEDAAMVFRPIPAATYNLVTAGEAEIERGTEQYPVTVDEVSNPSPDPEIRALPRTAATRCRYVHARVSDRGQQGR